MDMEAYTRMYLWDTGFREYANGVCAIDDFIERFVVTYIHFCKRYRLNNIEYLKYDNGRQCWLMNGNYHKTDGPAIIYVDGSEEWYKNGLHHRDDGPAIIFKSGSKIYCQDGKRHRLDGPAVIYANGNVEYWEYEVRIYK
jgi:hypothetical protein